jgi:hypothetical protein
MGMHILVRRDNITIFFRSIPITACGQDRAVMEDVEETMLLDRALF